MLDFILVPARLHTARVKVRGSIPVRSDHWMFQVTVLIPGQPGGQPVGTLPRVFQTSASKIGKEALQSFAAAHSA